MVTTSNRLFASGHLALIASLIVLGAIADPDCWDRYNCTLDAYDSATQQCTHVGIPSCVPQCYYGEQLVGAWPYQECVDCTSSADCIPGAGCVLRQCVSNRCVRVDPLPLGCCETDIDCPYYPGKYAICVANLGVCQYYDPREPLRRCNATNTELCRAAEDCDAIKGVCYPAVYPLPTDWYDYARYCLNHFDCANVLVAPMVSYCLNAMDETTGQLSYCTSQTWPARVQQEWIDDPAFLNTDVLCDADHECPPAYGYASMFAVYSNECINGKCVFSITEKSNFSCCQSDAECVSSVWCWNYTYYPACTTSGVCFPAGYYPGWCAQNANCATGEYCHNHMCIPVPICPNTYECVQSSFSLVFNECLYELINGCTVTCFSPHEQKMKVGSLEYCELVSAATEYGCVDSNYNFTGRPGCCREPTDCPAYPGKRAVCAASIGICQYFDESAPPMLCNSSSGWVCSEGLDCARFSGAGYSPCVSSKLAPWNYTEEFPLTCVTHADCSDLSILPFVAVCAKDISNDARGHCKRIPSGARFNVSWLMSQSQSIVPCSVDVDCPAAFGSPLPHRVYSSECVNGGCLFSIQRQYSPYECRAECIRGGDSCFANVSLVPFDGASQTCFVYHLKMCANLLTCECTTTDDCTDDAELCTEKMCMNKICVQRQSYCPTASNCSDTCENTCISTVTVQKACYHGVCLSYKALPDGWRTLGPTWLYDDMSFICTSSAECDDSDPVTHDACISINGVMRCEHAVDVSHTQCTITLRNSYYLTTKRVVTMDQMGFPDDFCSSRICTGIGQNVIGLVSYVPAATAPGYCCDEMTNALVPITVGDFSSSSSFSSASSYSVTTSSETVVHCTYIAECYSLNTFCRYHECVDNACVPYAFREGLDCRLDPYSCDYKTCNHGDCISSPPPPNCCSNSDDCPIFQFCWVSNSYSHGYCVGGCDNDTRCQDGKNYTINTCLDGRCDIQYLDGRCDYTADCAREVYEVVECDISSHICKYELLPGRCNTNADCDYLDNDNNSCTRQVCMGTQCTLARIDYCCMTAQNCADNYGTPDVCKAWFCDYDITANANTATLRDALNETSTAFGVCQLSDVPHCCLPGVVECPAGETCVNDLPWVGTCVRVSVSSVTDSISSSILASSLSASAQSNSDYYYLSSSVVGSISNSASSSSSSPPSSFVTLQSSFVSLSSSIADDLSSSTSASISSSGSLVASSFSESISSSGLSSSVVGSISNSAFGSSSSSSSFVTLQSSFVSLPSSVADDLSSSTSASISSSGSLVASSFSEPISSSGPDVECANDVDCSKGNQCYHDHCDAGVCVHEGPLEGCCNSVLECSDLDACKTWACEVQGHGSYPRCYEVTSIENCCLEQGDCDALAQPPCGHYSCTAQHICQLVSEDGCCSLPQLGYPAVECATDKYCFVGPSSSVGVCLSPCSNNNDCPDISLYTSTVCNKKTKQCEIRPDPERCVTAADCIQTGDPCLVRHCSSTEHTCSTVNVCSCMNETQCPLSPSSCKKYSCLTNTCMLTPRASPITCQTCKDPVCVEKRGWYCAARDCSSPDPCVLGTCDPIANKCVYEDICVPQSSSTLSIFSSETPAQCLADSECGNGNLCDVDKCENGVCKWYSRVYDEAACQSYQMTLAANVRAKCYDAECVEYECKSLVTGDGRFVPSRKGQPCQFQNLPFPATCKNGYCVLSSTVLFTCKTLPDGSKRCTTSDGTVFAMLS